MRAVAYIWAAPTTVLGLTFAPLAVITGGCVRCFDGVVEIHGGIVTFFLSHCTLLPGGATAMTLGHVVLGLDQLALNTTREHERIHVRQAEKWGPLFLPAYVIASCLAWITGGNPYYDNAFEREAYSRSSP